MRNFCIIKHMQKMSGFRVTHPPILNFGKDLPPLGYFANFSPDPKTTNLPYWALKSDKKQLK